MHSITKTGGEPDAHKKDRNVSPDASMVRKLPVTVRVKSSRPHVSMGAMMMENRVKNVLPDALTARRLPVTVRVRSSKLHVFVDVMHQRLFVHLITRNIKQPKPHARRLNVIALMRTPHLNAPIITIGKAVSIPISSIVEQIVFVPAVFV